MTLARESKVSVLVVTAALALATWTSGCGGFVERSSSVPPPPTNAAVSSVTISPSSTSSAAGASVQFTATVHGTAADKSVTWKTSLGTITPAGLFTAPASAGTALVTAISNAEPTRFASAAVTALVPPSAAPTRTPDAKLLSASAAALNFNNVDIGNSSALPVNFTNVGSSDVAISNVSISGAGYNTSGTPTGLVLSPGQTATLTVTFAPAATGSVTGSVNVASNASNSPASITLLGTGIQPIAHSATLTWTASTTPTVTGYNVYRATVSGGYAMPLNPSPIPGSTTQFEDSTVQAGHNYYYVVTILFSDDMQTAYSNEVLAMIPKP
jgi:uncharacterized membrane protein YphA (DoxX/SURF4 family)